MIQRRILAAVALLCVIAAPAHAQKTKAQITTEIGTLFPDNTVGQITPLGLRTVALDTVNSIMPTAPVVAGNLACFSGTTGLLQDCGSAPTTVPITVGVTPIGSGTTTRVLYDNAGILGEYSTSGTGSVCMSIACVMTTPNLGTPSSLILTNATALPATVVTGGQSGGVLCFNSTTTSLSSTLLAANGVMVGGGVGACPGAVAAGVNGQVFLGVTAGAPQWGTVSGDATISNTGALTFATVNSNTGAIGSATQCVTVTNNAKGLTTAVTAATCTPAIGSITGLGTGIGTALGLNVGSAGAPVLFNGAGGTPSSMTGTNITGTAAGLTAGNVTTNANLTGVITSVGNATSIASQTGTGTKFVVDNTPTLITPVLGVATGTSLALGGATIGANALGVTGSAAVSGALTSGVHTVTSTSASALAVGPAGTTNSTLNVNSGTASAANGLNIVGAATGGTLALSVTDPGANSSLSINAKAAGTIGIGNVSTGAVTITPATTLSNALTYGGVTLSNSVTGTGPLALGTSPTLSGLTVTGSFTATGLVPYAALASAAIGSSAEYLAGTSSKLVQGGVIYPTETTTTFGATTTLDFSTFINTAVTLTGNITTQTLSNVTAGKAGTITFIQDGTGSRTSVWNSVFKFASGTTPTLTTTASAIDVLTYSCRSATFCVASLIKDVR